MAKLPPETAHRLTIKLLSAGGGVSGMRRPHPSLRTSVAGLTFSNPLGLAAGFDKNAEVPDVMLRLGFGFVEVGAATPEPQFGNARPRVFRLTEDRAVINRYGFNNDGHAMITARLRRVGVRRARAKHGVIGVNLGANKTSDDRAEDYVLGISAFDGLVDFYTVNISSPNTPGLRALQSRASLDDLLARVMAAQAVSTFKAPVFLKISPDLTDVDKADIAAAALGAKIDGVIISNTTIDRPDTLNNMHAGEGGGLSGRPLFHPSTAVLREFATTLDRQIPLIGVGGVANAADAYAKILNGASLVQLYTALVYEGPTLIAKILTELPQMLAADGFSSVDDAVGKWL